ncbi:hypothetical protein SAMN05661008_01284 [Alkalithermobacter thermoalcaliphilus JW-YL-7 = DSM 7308]|uniref:Prepilin-type N-terminal cleavage/methylation domain-containing protein n=1 Tax=Alkalithermobacter thermoalcaliphilus JW-YL-7 = DSM 7308 TaxID=1121328 RepID=A0A150FR59_CLOPD|nr:hypothetical protein JWYL7_1154 [[Clostridium] paradoxum JW-YL-7 = DSM 7308]SHL00848.1 hypothetical protein SAMN05661008_01284 [[Clostridium] paradoxum JW-YL-7 = DSM 7308]
MKKCILDNNGITLIEVIVSISVISISFLSLMSLYTSSFVYSIKSKDSFKANIIANNYIENMKHCELETLLNKYSKASFIEDNYEINTNVIFYEDFIDEYIDNISSDLQINIDECIFINNVEYNLENIKIIINKDLTYEIKPLNINASLDNKNIYILQKKDSNITINIKNYNEDLVNVYLVLDNKVKNEIVVNGYNYSLTKNFKSIDNNRLYNMCQLNVSVSKDANEILTLKAYRKIR